MNEKDEIKINLKMIILLILFIIAIIIIASVVVYNFYKEKSNNTENVLIEDLQNVSELKDNISEEEKYLKYLIENNVCDENSIYYLLSKKYYYDDDEVFIKYYSKVLEIGDCHSYAIVECNYENNLIKYNKPIIFTMAMVKDYLYNEPYEGARIDNEELKRFKKRLLEERKSYEPLESIELYEDLNGMSIRNGNCESEESYKNNSRAKKLELTINDTEKHIIELEDTNEVQLCDLNYKQTDIGKPITVKIEVLEVYNGLVSDDIYINEIGFGLTSNGYGGI